MGCTTYLTSKLSQESRLISQALTSKCLSAWTIGVVYTSQTERVIVLSKILAVNKSLALLLSVLLAASVGTTTIGQYRRIGCHDNFVKAKDASSRVRDRSWNMTFYLNVFFIYLPTIKDVVRYITSSGMICYNVYIPLQMMWRKIQVLQYFISLIQHLPTLVFSVKCYWLPGIFNF